MSLKSFDNFCAKMVNNEPLSQKEILDERQKITRQKITIQAAIMFAIMCVANALIMDFGLKWSESYAAPMMWFYIASVIYWLVANSVKGSLFGIEGTIHVKRNGFVFIFISVVDGLSLIFDEKELVVLKDGVLSNRFMMLIMLVMALMLGIISFILAYRYNRKQKSQDD